MLKNLFGCLCKVYTTFVGGLGSFYHPTITLIVTYAKVSDMANLIICVNFGHA